MTPTTKICYFLLQELTPKHIHPKNIFVKITLFIFNSLLKIKRLLVYILKNIIIKPLKISGYFFIKIFILPFYRIYYWGKIRLGKRDLLPSRRFSSLITRPIIIPILLLVLTFSVVIDNIQAQETIAHINGKSILSSLVDPEQGEDIVEEVIIQELPKFAPTSYFPSEAFLEPTPAWDEEALWQETAQELSDPLLLSGTLYKPHLLTATSSVTARTRTETENYLVQSGDTVSSIAVRFGISVNTILWENSLRSYTLIRPGDTLKILPKSGISHTVKKNETLNGIANKYKIEPEDILKANQLALDATLQIGQKLVIPGGKKIYYSQPTTLVSRLKNIVAPPSAKLSGAKLQWPTTDTRITQYYHWRHHGLDIGGTLSSPIYAAEGGVVDTVGWGSGYGYQILIKHDNGMKTRYAHLSKFHVSKGQRVARGETIGMVGSTGRSTGPHLHFEVYDNGYRRNPLDYIR